jgi:hypothetical protein
MFRLVVSVGLLAWQLVNLVLYQRGVLGDYDCMLPSLLVGFVAICSLPFLVSKRLKRFFF